MIRQIRNKVELTAALSLIWETFLQFEAPDYSNEGVKSFREFIENEDEIEVDMENGKIISKNGEEIEFKPLPPFMLEILNEGGLIPYLRKKHEE